MTFCFLEMLYISFFLDVPFESPTSETGDSEVFRGMEQVLRSSIKMGTAADAIEIWWISVCDEGRRQLAQCQRSCFNEILKKSFKTEKSKSIKIQVDCFLEFAKKSCKFQCRYSWKRFNFSTTFEQNGGHLSIPRSCYAGSVRRRYSPTPSRRGGVAARDLRARRLGTAACPLGNRGGGPRTKKLKI